MSDRPQRPHGWKGILGPAFLAAYFAMAPSTVEPWRLDPSVSHSVTLAVGEPVRLLDLERMRRRSGD